MKQLLDIWPILLFFIVYQVQDIYAATAAIVVAVVVQSGFFWWRNRRLSSVQTLTLVLVVLFGGATLLLRDPLFIQWKPTILQWIFAIAFVASHFVGDKLLIRRLLGGQIKLPDNIWKRLSLLWVAFFVLSGAVNLYVAYTFDEAIWVRFKLFGMLGMTFCFILAQGVWLSRYMLDEAGHVD